MQAALDSRSAAFNLLLLIGPVLLAFKQGFVRSDEHVIVFFSFAALAIALIYLTADFSGRYLIAAMAIGFIFFIFWAGELVGHLGRAEIFREAAGTRALDTTWDALHFRKLQQQLVSARLALAARNPMDPAVRAIIGNRAVTPLSEGYDRTFVAGLKIEIYPILQRYSAFTPYLDRLNAAWILEKGPTFLLFDGETIDKRDAWAESPSTWLAIYRWYNTRYLGPDNLLLKGAHLRALTLSIIPRASPSICQANFACPRRKVSSSGR